MSNFFHGKMFAKISELDESFGPYDSLNLTDEFVVVNDNITKKITGLNLTESIVSIGNLASKAYVDAVVDGAPELLNTLNEIAAALNDDSNFASNIISSINTKLPTANFGLEFWSALEGVNTFHIAEGSNLYYTQARFDAALAAKTTTALAEGDNLYYSEQRVLDVVIPLVPTSIFDLDVPEVSVNLPGYLHYNGTTLSWKSSTNPTYDTVTILAEPTSLLHAVTKGYVDSQLNAIQSDRLTNGILEVVLQSDGTVVLPADPTSDNHAATKGYVDNQVDTVVAGQGFATLGYVEDAIANALIIGNNDFTDSPDNPGSGGSSNYILPTASTVVKGGVKIDGTTIVIDGNGVISAVGGISNNPTFTSVTASTLNVQNVAFTGTGTVTINSNNDLNLTAVGDIFLNGERTISLAQLKTVVAASTDFANFKSRIAAL